MEHKNDDLVLAPEEIVKITHYSRPADQLKFLATMGIPATHRKHDNTVCVLRMYVTVPQAGAQSDLPK